MRGSIRATAVVGAVLVSAVFADDPDDSVVLEPDEARALAEKLRETATIAEETAREEDEAVASERLGRPRALPDVELQGVRRELARVAERGGAKANALRDEATSSASYRLAERDEPRPNQGGTAASAGSRRPGPIRARRSALAPGAVRRGKH